MHTLLGDAGHSSMMLHPLTKKALRRVQPPQRFEAGLLCTRNYLGAVFPLCFSL